MATTGLAGFFKNGTVKTILTVALTLAVTAIFAYARQGLQVYSKDEADEKFVLEEIYQRDGVRVNEKLDDILYLVRENREGIKELVTEDR